MDFILPSFKLTFWVMFLIRYIYSSMAFSYQKEYSKIFSFKWSIQIPDSFVVKFLEMCLIPKENTLWVLIFAGTNFREFRKQRIALQTFKRNTIRKN